MFVWVFIGLFLVQVNMKHSRNAQWSSVGLMLNAIGTLDVICEVTREKSKKRLVKSVWCWHRSQCQCGVDASRLAWSHFRLAPLLNCCIFMMPWSFLVIFLSTKWVLSALFPTQCWVSCYSTKSHLTGCCRWFWCVQMLEVGAVHSLATLLVKVRRSSKKPVKCHELSLNLHVMLVSHGWLWHTWA